MYKGKDDRNEVQGGPMYVITKGLGERMKPLAVVFSVAGMVGSFALMQANQLTEAMATVCISPLLGIADSTTMRFIIGVCICAIVSVVVLGGLKRIANVATKIVPIMVGCYFLMVLYIIVTNLDLLPSTFAAIINGAFNLQAGIGGIVGTAIIGARRAMYVNEAGVGTAGMMHGASMNAEPVREGLVAMLGPAIDSGLVCTLTAIPIIMAGNFHTEGIAGLSIALEAYDILIPVVGKYLLLVMVVVFAMSTMFSYSYYGCKCTSYLFGSKNAKYYLYFYLLTLVISSVMTLGLTVSVMDIAFAVMAFPNMFAVFCLAPKVKEEIKKFKSRK